MKTAKFLLLILVLGSTARAQEFFPVPEVKFQLQGTDVERKLEETLNAPESLLKRFSPEGAKISKKEVQNNHIKFLATKTVLLISKTVLVNGVLDANENNQGCPTGQTGQDVKFDFAGSDSLVYDNVDSLEVKLCIAKANANLANVTAQPKIIRGNNYSSTLGGIARDMIKAQIAPLIKALTEEIKVKK